MIVGAQVITNVVDIMKTSPVSDFLINVAASVFYDGAKKIYSHFQENSTDSIIWDIFAETMAEFYGKLHYEYDEDIVVSSLLDALHSKGEKLSALNLQDCLQEAMYVSLTDQDFYLWVSIFANRCAQHPEIFQMYQVEKEIKEAIFTKRNLLIERMISKILISIGQEDHSDHLFTPIIEYVETSFQQSWKEELLSLLAKMSPIVDDSAKADSLRDLIMSNENCEIVLGALKQLYLLHEKTGTIREIDTQVKERLRHPHFNKVLLIEGKTGSGKTYFVNELLEYVTNSLDEFEDRIIPCIIDTSKIESGKSFENILCEQFSDFIGVELTTIERINQVLKETTSILCFVLDGLSNHFSSQKEWTEIIRGIKNCSKYDQLRWIVTIDEFDYFFMENDDTFLDMYCLTWREEKYQSIRKESLFHNALSIDQFNNENSIVSLILNQKYGINKNTLQNLSLLGISTPKEAIIFGEIVPKGEMIGFPSTYYEYLENITLWKNNELVGVCEDSVDKVLSPVINHIAVNHTDELDKDECDENCFKLLRRAQLVNPDFKRETSIFSLSQGKVMTTYRLNIYPFWAVKLTHTIYQKTENIALLLTSFPKQLQQSLIPSYLFYTYEQQGQQANDLFDFFNILNKNNVLVYALFVAHRASIDFSSNLYEYLNNNMDSYINCAQTCYSVLFFVFNSKLKMKEKLELLNKIEHYIPMYGFHDIYERTFSCVISAAQSEKNFKRNLVVVTKGEEASINYINGKNAAVKYLSMSSVGEKEIEKITWDIIDYIKAHDLISQIDINLGNNESFIDFFIRRCFENFLVSDTHAIQTVYDRFEMFFELERPFDHFVKRNLTCAAGNVFSNIFIKDYCENYISLVREMADSNSRQNRLTAFFLIENSVNDNSTELHPDLKEILISLYTDKDLFKPYTSRIEEMIK